MKLKSLSTTTLAALNKAIETELKTRDALNTGKYDVAESVSFNVAGTVTKSADEEYTPTIKIAHKVAMALLVRHCGCTGPAALKALETAMTEAVNVNVESEEYIAAMADLELAEEKVQTMLGKLPKATRTGKTTIKVKVD
jgi:hypothetical protein